MLWFVSLTHGYYKVNQRCCKHKFSLVCIKILPLVLGMVGGRVGSIGLGVALSKGLKNAVSISPGLSTRFVSRPKLPSMFCSCRIGFKRFGQVFKKLSHAESGYLFSQGHNVEMEGTLYLH